MSNRPEKYPALTYKTVEIFIEHDLEGDLQETIDYLIDLRKSNNILDARIIHYPESFYYKPYRSKGYYLVGYSPRSEKEIEQFKKQQEKRKAAAKKAAKSKQMNKEKKELQELQRLKDKYEN